MSCKYYLNTASKLTQSLKAVLACFATVAQVESSLICYILSQLSPTRLFKHRLRRIKLIAAIATLSLFQSTYASAVNYAAIRNNCSHSISLWSIDRNNESSSLSVVLSSFTRTVELQYDATIRVTRGQVLETAVGVKSKGDSIVCDIPLEDCVEVEYFETQSKSREKQSAVRRNLDENYNSCYCCPSSSGSATAEVRIQTSGLERTSTLTLDLQAQYTRSPSQTQSFAPQYSTLPRVSSWLVPKACGWDIPWPLPDTPMPVIDNEDIPQLSIFQRPATVANSITIYNFCEYDLWLEPNVGSVVASIQHISPRGKINRPFHTAEQGFGVSLKVSRVEASFENPVQVEYAVKGDGKVWYNLSLIDCLGKTGEIRNGKPVRNGNTSACAGHEAATDRKCKRHKFSVWTRSVV